MALRFPRLWLSPALFACGIFAMAAPVPRQSPTHNGQPITIGRGVVPLSGPWKFQTGDSPLEPTTHAALWAQPDFDDSKWEDVSLTPTPGVVAPVVYDPRWVRGWTVRGHPNYTGWAWYRLRISIVNESPERLALDGPFWVDDAYQLFANGMLLGGYGEFAPSGKSKTIYSQTPVLFVLPETGPRAEGQATPTTLTLAVRVWMGVHGLLRMPDAGGMHFAPLLGGEEAITAQYKLDWYVYIHSFLSAPLQPAAILLLGIVACSLLLFDKSDRAYLWVAAVLLFSAFSDALIMAGILIPHLVNARLFYVYLESIYLPLHMGGWAMVWWAWFRLRRPRWMPSTIAILTVSAMIAGALAEGVFQGATPHPVGPVFRAAPTAIRALLLALMVFIVVKGIREHGVEGWLVLPTLLPVALVHFQGQLANPYVPLYWRMFGVTFSIENLANFLLASAMALLLLRRLLRSVDRQRRLALDIKQAQEVQQVILPERRTVLPGMVVECEFHPALEVGGDFFQVIPHPDDGSLLIVAGDVTGKGLQAGMLVALLVGAIRTLAPYDPDPLSILAALNQRLCHRRQAHATGLALRIAASGEATLANAGHLPPYINGELLSVEGTLPLGMIENPEFSVANFHLSEGDRLVLVSDGVVEATNSENLLFGFERVQDLLKEGTTAAAIAEIAERFGQQDDISVISVTRVPVPEEKPNLQPMPQERFNLGIAQV
jgi:Stage II sporulation protein E (SpoIIE)